jgi:hypothetical protein
MEEIEAGRVKTHSFEEIKNMSAGTNHTNKLLTYRTCNGFATKVTFAPKV